MQRRALIRRLWLAATVTAAAFAVVACVPSPPSIGGDPASPSPLWSRSTYQSPFKGYVRMELVEPRPWRATNDRVRDLGGANAQMQGDTDEDPASSPSPSPRP